MGNNENLNYLTFTLLKEGKLEEVEKLFNSSVDVFYVSESKCNWLHKVLMGIPSKTPAKTIKYLIDKGVSPTAKDCYDMTPLHYAMRGENIEAAKILLEAGSDANAKDISGRLIPFRMACGQPFNQEIVEFFLEHGANIYEEDSDGRTLMEIVKKYLIKVKEEAPLVKFFLDYEAKLKAEGKLPPKPPKSDKKVMISDKPLHDGKSEIKIKEYDSWIEQYKELWNLLVPKRGKALIIQGEVIRICGKLEHEVLDNGKINWDKDFELMTNTLRRYLLKAGTLLSEEENKKVKSIISKIKRGTVKEKDFDILTKLCTKWILLNPIPFELKTVPYNR